MKENTDRNRTIRFTVRVNGKEAKWLKEAAWREKRSVADFIRSRAISGELPRIPVEVSELMKQLTYEVNRIGVNINQLVRSYHINGYHTSSEKRRREEDLKGHFDFEDDEGSFFMRHLRGIVGLALFAILLLMFVIYAFSKPGQLSLARINAAWSKDAYSTLGFEYYQAGNYSQAGLYYERALQRDPTSYSFASSAAMAYLEAGDNERATAMLKRCAEIDPAKLEPYAYLLKLYPDAASRPWDITQLLQQGYQRTGDTRLNVTG